MNQIAESSKLIINYDQSGDVLYVALGQPKAAEGQDRPYGIVLRYAEDDYVPCGVTIIGYKQYHWDKKRLELVDIISSHLAIDHEDVLLAINKTFH